MSLKSNVESLLFAFGRRTTVEELARILRIHDHQKILDALSELKADYDAKAGPIVVRQEDAGWKMTVADEQLSVVRKVVSKTELPKGVMETLAIIAYKAPVMQSDIVKLRTNKAYDHLALLQDSGFLTREKSGRTKLIKLAKKFFDYFDVPETALKERFSSVAALEKVIGEKEGEIDAVVRKQQEHNNIVKQDEERHKAETDSKHRRLDEELAKMPAIDLVDEEGHKERLAAYTSDVVDAAPSRPVLSPDVQAIDEPETFTLPRQRKQTQPQDASVPEPVKAADVLKDETATGEEKADALREELEPETAEREAVVESEEEAAKEAEQEADDGPPEGTSKYDPHSIEHDAKKVARGLKSREGKGLFSEGMTREVEAQIDEKVANITGVHEAPKEEQDHAHETPPESDAASDVHVSPEEGEAEERKKGGPDTHNHPGEKR